MNPTQWSAPAIVLDVRPFEESDAIAVLLTRERGLHRGLARGGAGRGSGGRGGRAVWQPGNLVQARWQARLPEQLGAFEAELVHPAAALAMDDRLALRALSAACALAACALPEREPVPAVFEGLLRWIAALAGDRADMIPELVRWELALLAALGYGLDLSRCGASGERTGLRHVSPRTGRAVTDEAAGAWRDRLLPLPGFLVGGNAADMAAARDGLALTGHFLARDAFGARHRPVPAARLMLYDQVAALAAAETGSETGPATDAGDVGDG